jgi:hypothetical protein
MEGKIGNCDARRVRLRWRKRKKMLRVRRRRMTSVRPRMEPILALEENFCQNVGVDNGKAAGVGVLEVVGCAWLGVIIGLISTVGEVVKVVCGVDIGVESDKIGGEVGFNEDIDTVALALDGEGDEDTGDGGRLSIIAGHFEACGGPGSITFEIPKLFPVRICSLWI